MTWRALGSAVGLLGLLSGPARADGVFVWNKGADLYEPTQRALVYFDGEEERLILQARYEGPAQDFAWVVPVPAVPEVAAVEPDGNPFAELSGFTQKRLRPPGRGEVQPVEVITREVVGIYDVAVLSAATPESLSAWLSANGYVFPADRAPVLQHYTDRGWYYVAMRIDPEALTTDAARQLSTGEAQPVRLRFRAAAPVYPFKITSANAGETELIIYLLAAVPLVIADDQYVPALSVAQNLPLFGWNLGSDIDERFGTFRPVRAGDLPLTWKALKLAADRELYLMKYRASFKTAEITDDLVFRAFDPASYWRTHLRLEEGDAIRGIDRGLFVDRKIEEAEAQLGRGEASLALRSLDEALAADPGATRADGLARSPRRWYRAHWFRGHAYRALGDCGRALAQWEAAESPPAPSLETRKDCDLSNTMAWVLATCADPRYRDGKRAVALADSALSHCRKSAACDDLELDAELVDTLAAAYAEDGQFDRAVELLKGLRERLGPQGPARFLQHLESYEQRRPWREE